MVNNKTNNNKNKQFYLIRQKTINILTTIPSKKITNKLYNTCSNKTSSNNIQNST